MWILLQIIRYITLSIVGYQYDTLSYNFPSVQKHVPQYICETQTWTIDILSVYNFDDDSSLQKFVSPEIGLNDKKYKPTTLVKIPQNDVLYVRNNQWELREETIEPLIAMASWFYSVFNKPLIIISTYRSYYSQQKLLSWYTDTLWKNRAATLSALPWHSEHQLGLAIDVFDASTNEQFYSGYASYVDWLQNNAHIYGWTQSYQKWREIDWYVVEPWHWRYVWVPLATYLWENKMTFGEFAKISKIWR